MDDAEELRLLRSQVRASAHDVFNTLGIALNYLDFLGEDISSADPRHPVWQQLEPIQSAVRRAVETVRTLRDDAVLAQERAERTPVAGAGDPPADGLRSAHVPSGEGGPLAHKEVGAHGAQHGQQHRDHDHQ